MIAIVSDIHANLEAIRAVLSDIEKHNVSDIICLGDVIGYGPNPGECLDLAMNFKVTLQGNHEKALLVSLEGANFNEIAKNSIEWTRQQLDMLAPEHREVNAKRWDFIGELNELYKENTTSFAHGSPRHPTIEYVYDRDINSPKKLGAIFEFVEHVCFIGHTHMPGIWTDDMVFIAPEEANYQYPLTGKKTLVNVGSVGQPRDRDIRSCYVLFDGDKVFFRRVSYPVEETFKKIKSIPELNPRLAERLKVAR